MHIELIETAPARAVVAKPSPAARQRADDELDLVSVAASVKRKLGPAADPARVDAVLAGLAAELLPGARVRQYLPVILQRKACDRLRAEAAAQRPRP